MVHNSDPDIQCATNRDHRVSQIMVFSKPVTHLCINTTLSCSSKAVVVFKFVLIILWCSPYINNVRTPEEEKKEGHITAEGVNEWMSEWMLCLTLARDTSEKQKIELGKYPINPDYQEN